MSYGQFLPTGWNGKLDTGLWNTWIDRVTVEIHESYTMLTVNCDRHPLMRRMHRPKPNLSFDQQGKRSVVPLESCAWNDWLTISKPFMP